MIYTQQDADTIKQLLRAEEVSVQFSTLGGAHNASIMILVCLEPRTTWSNGILQNSKYARFALHSRENRVELFSGGLRTLKFRKAQIKTVEDAAAKIQKWIDAAMEQVNVQGINKAF